MAGAPKIVALALLITQCLAKDVGYDKDELKKLTEYSSRLRKTIDGRACAPAFVQNDLVYTGCSKAKSPDGNTGGEWCYVPLQGLGHGDKDWGYCRGVIEYDFLLAKARDTLQLKTRGVKKTVDELAAMAIRMQDTIAKYTETCGASHQVVPKRLEKISESIHTGKYAITSLKSGMQKVERLRKTIEDTESDIKRDTPSALRSETNCEAVRGYEDEPLADGLRGSYYSNPYFEGTPTGYRDDPTIDFSWDSASPIFGVPYQHFSVLWDGHIQAPDDDDYVFCAKTDTGVTVYLDESPIIMDRMPAPVEGDALGNKPIKLLPPSGISGTVKTCSDPQTLVGGRKYKLRVRYIHVSSFQWIDPAFSRITLTWRSSLRREEVIPRESLYKSNPKKPMRISGLPADSFSLSLLVDGEYAFVGSTRHIVADVPPKFQEAKFLRTTFHTTRERISFSISTDSMMHVAIPRGSSVPFNPTDASIEFTASDDVLSIYIADSNMEKAERQITMGIYSARVPAGKLDFIVTSDAPTLIFFTYAKESAHACPGDSKVVSLTDSATFESCTASSYSSEEYNCRAGLGGKNLDVPYGSWHTAPGQGAGAHVLVTFQKPIEFEVLQFKTRDDAHTWPTRVTLQFPGSADETFDIIPGSHSYQILSRPIAKTVKLTITDVAETQRAVESGGSFSFIGIPCGKQAVAPPKGEEHPGYIAISFRSDMAGFPPRDFLIDDGSRKRAHGELFFGWEHTAPPVDGTNCLRDMALKDIPDGGISFPPQSGALECTSGEADCTPNSWSIDMPYYGRFVVTATVGTPCGKLEVNELQVNGVPFIEPELLKPGQFSKATGEVLLTASSTIRLSSSTRTTLQSIIIERVEVPSEDHIEI